MKACDVPSAMKLAPLRKLLLPKELREVCGRMMCGHVLNSLDDVSLLDLEVVTEFQGPTPGGRTQQSHSQVLHPRRRRAPQEIYARLVEAPKKSLHRFETAAVKPDGLSGESAIR